MSARLYVGALLVIVAACLGTLTDPTETQAQFLVLVGGLGALSIFGGLR